MSRTASGKSCGRGEVKHVSKHMQEQCPQFLFGTFRDCHGTEDTAPASEQTRSRVTLAWSKAMAIKDEVQMPVQYSKQNTWDPGQCTSKSKPCVCTWLRL
eukprot:scaffold140748_cov18-Tisochrysis_lutea.AAC.1